MKTILAILLILLLSAPSDNKMHEKKIIFQAFQSGDSCPPFYEDTKDALKNFLSNVNYNEERQEFEIQNVQINDVSHLSDEQNSMACQELRQISDWPLEYDYRTYYKSDNFYFIANAPKPLPPADEGKVNIQFGHDLIIVLDEEFDVLGSVIL